MFTNLYRTSPEFQAHNYQKSGSEVRPVPDPSPGVAEAFRIRRPYRPEPALIETLAFTMSPQCCKSFLRQSHFPVTARDYYLSKLYQFLLIAYLDESTDPGFHARVPRLLEGLLDAAIPEGFRYMHRLCRLDWQALFDENADLSVGSVVNRITSYLPGWKATEIADRDAKAAQLVPMDDSSLRSQLEEVMWRRGDKQAYVAKCLGISQSTMHRIVKGKQGFGSDQRRQRIQKYLRDDNA